MDRSTLCSWIVLSLLAVAVPASAQAPALIPIRGTLLDTDGAPVDGEHAMTFELFDNDGASGAALHAERHPRVDVRAGYFEAYLGEGDAAGLDLTVFASFGDTWLRVTLDDSEVLQPLFRIGSVPYAAHASYATHAGNADTLGSEAPSNFARTTETLAGLSCASADQVALWDGSNWTCGAIAPDATYSDNDARAAMGALDSSNPLNHARYSDVEAVNAMGVKDPSNPLSHDRYTDGEAVGAMGSEDPGNALNHARYDDGEAVSAMGAKGDANPLHHDRYTDGDAVSAMGVAGDGNPLNHDRYTDTDARAACYDTKDELTTELDAEYAAAGHNHDGRYVKNDFAGTFFPSIADPVTEDIIGYVACMRVQGANDASNYKGGATFRSLYKNPAQGSGDCDAVCPGNCLGSLIPYGTSSDPNNRWGDRGCSALNAHYCCCD